jgi:hypothetical protein
VLETLVNQAVVLAVAITGSAGKKIRGSKPHILVDIEGLLSLGSRSVG